MRTLPRHHAAGNAILPCAGSGLPIPEELNGPAVECPFCERMLAIEGETMGRTTRKTIERCCMCGHYVRTVETQDGPAESYGSLCSERCAREMSDASPERIEVAKANIAAHQAIRRAAEHLSRGRAIHGAHRRLATLAIAAVAMLSLLTACGHSPVAPSEIDETTTTSEPATCDVNPGSDICQRRPVPSPIPSL